MSFVNTRRTKPSLMKGSSSFANHLHALDFQERLMQKVVANKRISPRSSRLLASTQFMNRNSTAQSSLNPIGTLITRDNQNISPSANQEYQDFRTMKQRPMSSKVAGIRFGQPTNTKPNVLYQSNDYSTSTTNFKAKKRQRL